jgi:hypothetical protein
MTELWHDVWYYHSLAELTGTIYQVFVLQVQNLQHIIFHGVLKVYVEHIQRQTLIFRGSEPTLHRMFVY